MNYSLYELYKSPEVNRISTFGDVAAQISPRDIETAYAEARDVAPRRHDHNKKYFVEHAGMGNRSDNSNRKEEHLALALYSASRSADPMVLPCDRTLDILDYQTPLKAQRRDAGIGKVDLTGLIDGRRLAVIELKVRPDSNRHGDTPLRAYLEALAYCAIVEANTTELATEASDRFDRLVDVAPPALVVMAPEDYWAGYFAHPRAGKWWPTLSTLAKETDERLNVETHFLGLRNIDIRMGGKGRPPELIGNHSVFDIAEFARG
jgi:hypothetical protein